MMTRTVLFLLLLLVSVKARSQSADDLKQFPVKKGTVDAAFNKEFSRIIKAYSNNLGTLKSDDKIISIIDTVYTPKLNFKE